jgi:hypothetical protein
MALLIGEKRKAELRPLGLVVYIGWKFARLLMLRSHSQSKLRYHLKAHAPLNRLSCNQAFL